VLHLYLPHYVSVDGQAAAKALRGAQLSVDARRARSRNLVAACWHGDTQLTEAARKLQVYRGSDGFT
jgi:hypothetical protein